MGIMDYLENPGGEVIYPITTTKAVYDITGKESLETMLTRLNHVTTVRLYASGWTGSAAPYTQTVSVTGVKASMNPILVSALEDGASLDTQKAYMKAFSIISCGTGTTNDGSVTFKVYQKPAINITVGLRGV